MIRYFQCMQTPAELAAVLRSAPANTNWMPISGTSSAPTADSLQTRMMADYVALAGRPGPAIAGKSYPAARTINRSTHGRADRPFETQNPGLRAPELAYMNIRKEVVVALSGAGLRWGAIDFGAESGDVMHFDDRWGDGAKIDRAKRAAAAAIPAGSQSLQAGGASCPADIAVDEHTALIFSSEAPLAARSDCDFRAVWTYTPGPSPTPFSALVYFYGNDACVTVDVHHPGGRMANWIPVRNPNLHPLTPNGPFTPDVKYEIGAAVQASRQHPVAIIPEIGVPSSGVAWAITDPGILAPDRAALSRLVDDTLGIWPD